MSSRNHTAVKPLPLKQRTSSIDPRRDHDMQTILSLTKLIKPREFFVTVDNFSIWRRHLAWALEDGADLRSYMTQRYSSSMVFMSLLLGTELSVLFNSAAVTTRMRKELFAENFRSVEFWTGITILVSVIVTILGLISMFTVWGMMSSVSDDNAHCILRSSIGQYVAELPGRFIVCAIYAFLLWVILFFFLLLPPGFWSGLLALITVGLYIHVVAVLSMFGRIIMHTGAMGSQRIFDEQFERTLLPKSLHNNLRSKALASLNNNVSITRQYRRPLKPLEHEFTPSDLESSRSVGSSLRDRQFSPGTVRPSSPSIAGIARPRADSAVRFADNLWSTTLIRESSTAPTPERKHTVPSSRKPQSSSSETPPELPLRPPRPEALRNTNPVFSGSESILSLEEWLTGNNGTDISPLEPPDSVSMEPTVDSMNLLGSEEAQVHRGGMPSPIGDNFGWLPPRNASMNLTTSQSSSTGSFDHHEARPLTDDEKFDLEYGDDIARRYDEDEHLLADKSDTNYESTHTED